MPLQCVKCKGTKMLCGRSKCPVLIRVQEHRRIGEELKGKEVEGESVGVFVGSYGYPKVNIGPLTGKNVLLGVDSSEWFGAPLHKIIEHKSRLLRGKQSQHVSMHTRSRNLEAVQEIAMSRGKVFTDVVFSKRPKPDLSFSTTIVPYGLSGETEKVVIESNPKIPNVVEKIVSDELKAVEAMTELYFKGGSVDSIQKLLSAGLFGFKKKLVPTKWSITATDDTLGKKLLESIREFDEIDEYLVFSSEYLGNHFEVLLIPGKWGFEQLEYYAPGSLWVGRGEEPVIMKDWEGFKGRKKYAENVEGAYYAGRLAVCEWLYKKKKQARAIILREIRGEYYAPVGVWEVRENVRNAMNKKPLKFSSLAEALDSMRERLISNSFWEKNSEFLRIEESKEVLKKFMP